MLSHLKSLAGQSLIYGLGNLLPKAIGFLLIPLYTQFLSPSDYGILAFISTIIAVLGIIFELGTRGALTRFHYDYLEKPREERAYIGTIWIFLTSFSLLIALTLTKGGSRLFDIFFRETPFYPYGQYAIWISFFVIASVIPLVLFRVREQAHYFVLFSLGRFILMTVAIIYFVAGLQLGAEGSLKGQLLVNAIFFIPFTLVSLGNLRLNFQWRKLKESLEFGLPLVPHQLSGWALSVSDRILLIRFVTLSQLGLYSLGYRIAMITDIFLYSMNMAWAPFFFRTASTDKNAPQTFARLSTYIVISIVTFSLVIALLSRDLIIIMAQPAFYEAYRVVPVVVLAFITHGFYFLLVNQLFYAKHTKKLPVYTMVAAATNICLNLLLIPRYGIMAAAWNTFIGYTILMILVFRESQQVYPIPFEYRRITTILIAAGITYFLGNLISLGNVYLDIFLRLIVISIFPIILFLTRFFSSEEIAGIKSIPKRLQQNLSK